MVERHDHDERDEDERAKDERDKDDGRGDGGDPETFNPWSIVNLVFEHLADHGLHPVLGESGDPSVPARALLQALGIEPRVEGNTEVMRRVRSQLDELRSAVFDQ